MGGGGGGGGAGGGGLRGNNGGEVLANMMFDLNKTRPGRFKSETTGAAKDGTSAQPSNTLGAKPRRASSQGGAGSTVSKTLLGS